MKKFIVIAFMALAVTMIAEVPAKANDVTPTEDPSLTPSAMPNPYSKLIVRSDGSINLSNVYDSYFNLLTSDQQDLCNYLIGLSNYMYLTARGFTYENVSTSQQLISMLCTFGYRFWQVVPNEFSSRLTTYMQNYVAACVTYSAQQDDINGNLGAWIDNHSDDLYIPYSDNALVGWTAFYNDPSNLGVQQWGSYASDWVSGEYYDFAFSNISFENSYHQNLYNNFILNNSPVIYSPTYRTYQNLTSQYCWSINNVNLFDSLYIKRGSSFNQYRFGYTTGISNNIDVSFISYFKNDFGRIQINTTSTMLLYGSIYTTNTLYSLEGIIDYAFMHSPFYNPNVTWYEQYKYCYPYISHVYIVDDLNTLDNKEEISDIFTFGINDDNAKWIQTPNGQVLYYPIGSGAILQEFPLPEYLKKDDGNGNLVSIDPTKDLSQQIVNNTVINNYNIVAPGSIINVPIDWFDSDGNYLEYTNTTALPFFIMIGDIFNALGEIRIFIIAVLILGLASGVLVKFLL